MAIRLTVTSLVVAAFVSSYSSFASENTEQSKDHAPEISAAGAKLTYTEIPYLENAFIDASPANRQDGIRVGKLGADGSNKKMIVQFAKEIAAYKHGTFDSLLIAHKGKLVFESYYGKGRVNLPHYQASATKTYSGLALGRAIQLGYLSMDDLDKPFIDFLKQLDKSKLVKGADKITLRHALTMTSGIRVSDEQKTKIYKLPNQLKGQGEIQTILENSAPITKQSQTFKYGYGPALVMQVVEAVVPGSAESFIKNELLSKMGITNYKWRTNGSTGLPEAGWRSSITSRDMIKFGILAMDKGKWQGEQLIPAEFITDGTSRLLFTGDDDVHWGGKDISKQGYGYFWWGVDMKVGDKSYLGMSAQGGNGQIIMIVDELDLLIVHTAHDNKPQYKQIIAERLLPAFI
ncbi:serine hydrolase domain-containing protein [Pseudoalteromonas luteoviolacea]|uniref:serine hydrolase domain-containing protein n=1 Tax=Pseudoalteromonas luteoviolacea TaxID=43657 RepID=UPI001B3801DA|nr:serine hydrolase [Pseudoalteromonas luteoviolacea]MBQ4838532.1 serine hydrolase [Pseudoalteromonas luteoviolacea]